MGHTAGQENIQQVQTAKDVTVTKADHKTTLPEPIVKYAKAVLKGRNP